MLVVVSVKRFKFASSTTRDVRPVTDIFPSKLSRSETKAFRASELEKFGGGLGDLYTFEIIN